VIHKVQIRVADVCDATGTVRLIQHAIGIEYVIVNGELLISNGKQNGAQNGRLLRGA
jgi:hypothetical protein